MLPIQRAIIMKCVQCAKNEAEKKTGLCLDCTFESGY